MNPVPRGASESFQEAFCRQFRCPPEVFAKAVLRRSFPPWARVPGALLLALNPEMFRRELALIGRLGAVRGDDSVRGELEGYVYENERDKPFRVVTLHLRLSRRRFLRVFRTVMGPRAGGAAGVVGGTEAAVESNQPGQPSPSVRG